MQYFEPISILALSQSSNYKFTMAGNEKDNGCGGGSDGEGLSLGNFSQGACTTFLGHTDRFELEYEICVKPFQENEHSSQIIR